MRTVPPAEQIPPSGAGRVVWDGWRSAWFGTFVVAAVAGAVPAAIRAPGAVALCGVTTALTLCAGHSVGIHRGLIHRAYHVPRWLEHALVYLGVLVGLGGPIGLVRIHNTRDHQQNQPACHDFFAHRQAAWRDYFWNLHCRFEFRIPFDPRVDSQIARDGFYRFLERTWRWQQLPWALLFLVVGGWPWLVWGTFVRVAVSTTGHWFVGYVAHRTGYQAFANQGAAVQGWNSALLGAISMGEGWHNNHHTYPGSARIGIRWWEIDAGWWFIAALRALGLARDVRLPGDETRTPSATPVRDGTRPRYCR